MFRYVKVPPTTWVMQFVNGAAKRAGTGLSFFYWAPSTTLVLVPLVSGDVPFAFVEGTADYQEVTVQGQLTYRVAEPKKLAGLLDFSVGPTGAYRSEDPSRLTERLVSALQVSLRSTVGRLTLRQALASAEAIEQAAQGALRGSAQLQAMGLELLAVSVSYVRPTPEMARALEAEAREALQRESDEAIFARRAAAVEQERRVKQSEFDTELMVEEKRRHVRQTKIAADIAIEEERAKLVAHKAGNDRTQADGQAYALEKTLGPLRSLDWKVLTALSAGHADPAAMIAVAFRELAENAQRIGELNVSPDLLRSLLPSTAAPPKGK